MTETTTRQPIRPEDLTADDVFAARDRLGVRLEVGWFWDFTKGPCGCAAGVLAADRDPKRICSDKVSSREIAQALGWKPGHVWALSDGFMGVKSERPGFERSTPDLCHLYSVGREVRRRLDAESEVKP